MTDFHFKNEPSENQDFENDSANDKLERETFVLTSEIKSWWVLKIMKPIEDFCVKNRISPNSITMSALIICFGCFFLYSSGHFLSAGWLVLLAGSLDFLDGRVARATGKVTQAGAFLDSSMDRYQDFFLFAGLAIFYRDSSVLYLVLAAMAGSSFTPYVRAKADSLGIDLSNVGTFQRPERMFMVGFGSVVSSVFQVALMPFYGKGVLPPQHLLIAILLILAVATNVTALKRILFVMRSLENKESKND